MIRPNDLFTFHESLALNDDAGAAVGKVINDWEIRRYIDTRALKTRPGFIISVSQRIIIPANLVGQDPASGYEGYPALLKNEIAPTDFDPVNDVLELIDYSPITLNAAIDASVNSTVGQNSTDTKQYTSGSSTSTTNSYDVSINLSKMPGVSAGYSHSKTYSDEHSQTTGTGRGADQQIGSSASMSIKEWGSYLSIDGSVQTPSWIWTQEYPWNVYLYQDTQSSQDITVPPFVFDRLFLRPSSPPSSNSGDIPPSFTVTAAPPSSLALAGLNFISCARWIYLPASADSLKFAHTIQYWVGSHSFTTGPLSASVSLKQVRSEKAGQSLTSTVDRLSTYALAPLRGDSQGGALVSFSRSQIIPTWPGGTPVSISSTGNDLLVQCTAGFAFGGDTDSVLQADLTTATVGFSGFFKMTDPEQEFSLFVKHWKTSDVMITLTIVINDETPITRHVDARELGGGSDNVMRIVLRNLDYSSAEFFDYLVLGLNTITITATRGTTGSDPAGYALRALSIA